MSGSADALVPSSAAPARSVPGGLGRRTVAALRRPGRARTRTRTRTPRAFEYEYEYEYEIRRRPRPRCMRPPWS
ncbi:MAG: hypothetical protein HZA54_15785 [Planctomycetes bacterium]|nr:hypothetical protein [Planctomycetota bacterium]